MSWDCRRHFYRIEYVFKILTVSTAPRCHMLVSDGHVHSFDSIMYTCVKTSDFIIEIDTVIYLAIKIFF